MAIETPCQTPETWFDTEVGDESLTIKVRLPFSLNLSEQEAILLEANIHNALELVLARYFPRKNK